MKLIVKLQLVITRLAVPHKFSYAVLQTVAQGGNHANVKK